MIEPAAGQYVVVRTGGFPGAGWAIRLGTFSRWNHAAIYIGGGTVVEAAPSGVRYAPLSQYPAGSWVPSRVPLNGRQREAVLTYAHSKIGTPYGWADIAALALVALGVRPGWLDDYARNDSRLVCSQLVASAFDAAGVRLGGLDPWVVTPGDLAQFITEGDHA